MSRVSEPKGYPYGLVDELSQIFEDYYQEGPIFRQTRITEYFAPIQTPSPIDFSRYFASEHDLVIPTPDYHFGRSVAGFPSPPQPTPTLQRVYQDIQYLNQQYNKPVQVKLDFGTEPVRSWSQDDLQMD